MGLEQQIKSRAIELGFDAVGITDAAPVGAEHVDHFEAWLQAGYAGRMGYMHRHLDKRTNPAHLLPEARSVIVVALNYKPAELMIDEGLLMIGGGGRLAQPNHPSSIIHNQLPTGRVAQYAQYEDYHRFIKLRLHELAGFLCREIEASCRFKVCVDSAPLAEKALAARAGLGFIGKNHLLIHPDLGPQVLLGEIVTTLSLQPDGANQPRSCDGCDRCVKACPTGALRPDGFLDARRCISYLTKYEAGDDSRRCIDDWLYGCDECLLACPHYRRAPARKDSIFRHYPERARLSLRELQDLSPEELASRFPDAPMVRRELALLQRNAKICLENGSRSLKND